jgi:hypothetical protein
MSGGKTPIHPMGENNCPEQVDLVEKLIPPETTKKP